MSIKGWVMPTQITNEVLERLNDLKDHLTKVEIRICSVEANLEKHIHSIHRAFPRNDLDEPDFDGHRTYHIERKEDKMKVEVYKQSITNKILQGAAGFILMLVGLGAVSWLKGMK